MRRTRHWAAALAVTAAFAGAASSAPGRADVSASITIDPARSSGRLPATAIGINTAVWDSHLLDPVLPSLLRQAGIRLLRFPGGSTSDVYHWRTNSVEPGQSYADPANTFDAFLGLARRTGAQAIITVNYGSGSPAEAAAWVRYANITHHDGVRYWEIGNEIYGNGTYGAHWEYDTHKKGPRTYAATALRFVKAMKAVDPSIKIGVVLTAPGNWPDGLVLPHETMDWNNTVLSALGKQIDFADVHWYAQNPGNESDAGLLASTTQIPDMVSTLRSELARWGGRRGATVPIMLTETNSVSSNPGKQTVGIVNALFLADDYMTWLEHGVTNVDWWDVHNSPVTGANNSPSLYGSAGYGDYGVLSNGQAPEPPANTPFPAYYALRLLALLGGPGDRMVAASSSQSALAVHAVAGSNGRIAVVLANDSPDTAYGVAVRVKGAMRTYSATVYSYGPKSRAIATRRWPHPSVVTVPPYTLDTIVLAPAS